MLVEGTKLEADFKKWTENPWRIGDAPGGIRGFAPRLDHAIGVPAIHRCGRVGFFESVVEIGTRKV